MGVRDGLARVSGVLYGGGTDYTRTSTGMGLWERTDLESSPRPNGIRPVNGGNSHRRGHRPGISTTTMRMTPAKAVLDESTYPRGHWSEVLVKSQRAPQWHPLNKLRAPAGSYARNSDRSAAFVAHVRGRGHSDER